MDDFITLFLDEFGAPSSVSEVPEAVLLKYSQLLPECLLSLWKEYGWASFQKGLFWLTNPDDYAFRVNDWLRDIPELAVGDFYVFARTAFGDLYAFQPEMGRVISIICAHGFVVTKKGSANAGKGREKAMQSFFATAYPADFDFMDEDEQPLFERAFKVCGSLEANELYGFEPLLALGGNADLSNIKKLRLDVHLDIMKQFTAPVLRLV